MTLTTVTTTTSANNNNINKSNTRALTKIYYPNPNPSTKLKQSQQQQQQQKLLRKNNEIVQEQRPIVHRTSENNRVFNSGNILQYYYNNINNNNDLPNTNANANANTSNNSTTTTTTTTSTGNAEYLSKQSNININNIFAMSGNQQKLSHEKNQFSSTNRPLSLKVVTPKHVSNFFMKTFRSDSQKRPLMLNCSTIRKNEFHVGDGVAPNFKIIPDKTGLKISPIYSISQNIDKYTTRKYRQQQSSYFRNLNHGDRMMASCTRPLFVKKS